MDHLIFEMAKTEVKEFPQNLKLQFVWAIVLYMLAKVILKLLFN